jgi:hypothetical protein
MLSPEISGSSGYITNIIPNANVLTWVARIDFKMARDKFKRKDWLNGDGFAMYYLKSVS